MTDYTELVERLNSGDSILVLLSAIQAADAIESLQAEVLRLKNRLEIGEIDGIDGIDARDETIRVLDSKLDEYRDAPVVAWRITFKSTDTPDSFSSVHYHGTNAIADYRVIDPDATLDELIVKPGE